MDAALAPDPFLAQRLGRPAYTLAQDTDDPALLARAADRLRKEGAFAQAKARAEDFARIRALEAAGFGLADTNLTLERPQGGLPEPGPGFIFRAARPDDEAGVRHVARTSFRFSRFHLDPAIPDAVADRIKEDWAGNFFAGQRGDALLVAQAGDEVAGFLLLLRRGPLLVIDLVAVARAHQGKGAAKGMIAAADRELSGFDTWRTGTQAANTPSLGLYESLGFRMVQAAYVFHFHGEAS